MKKLLLTATATLVCFGVFAQGKLAFINNDSQLIYFTTDKSLMHAADANATVGGFALAGSGLWSGTISSLAGSPSIIAGLWAGTSSSSLARVTTTPFNATADFSGYLVQQNTTIAGLAAGVPAFFQFQVYDARNGSAAEAWAAGNYAGQSVVFQATPSSATYSPIYSPTLAASTMPIGNQVLSDYAGFPGYFGLIPVYSVPEPGMFALAGLGAAVLMIFRRRK